MGVCFVAVGVWHSKFFRTVVRLLVSTYLVALREMVVRFVVALSAIIL